MSLTYNFNFAWSIHVIIVKLIKKKNYYNFCNSINESEKVVTLWRIHIHWIGQLRFKIYPKGPVSQNMILTKLHVYFVKKNSEVVYLSVSLFKSCLRKFLSYIFTLRQENRCLIKLNMTAAYVLLKWIICKLKHIKVEQK